jgi:hypothetical protein
VNRILILAFVTLFLNSCNLVKFQEEANSKFADQYFKTAIAHVELYKIRYGQYPANLNELKYLGDWDAGIFSSVEYEKLPYGYRLDIVKGFIKGIPDDLKYPPDFWNGLGLKRSNLKPNPRQEKPDL